MKKPRRYQFLGWIIEKGLMGWYVLDWDYDGFEKTHFLANNERAAQDWCIAQGV